MSFFDKYLLQEITDPRFSKSFHISGTGTININQLRQGAVAFFIHAITFSFTKASTNIVTCNSEMLVQMIGATNQANIPITHKIEHIVSAHSLKIVNTEPTTVMTVHYQFIKHGGNKE